MVDYLSFFFLSSKSSLKKWKSLTRRTFLGSHFILIINPRKTCSSFAINWHRVSVAFLLFAAKRRYENAAGGGIARRLMAVNMITVLCRQMRRVYSSWLIVVQITSKGEFRGWHPFFVGLQKHEILLHFLLQLLKNISSGTPDPAGLSLFLSLPHTHAIASSLALSASVSSKARKIRKSPKHSPSLKSIYSIHLYIFALSIHNGR